ncbi:MAG: acylphosphatase [Candidatus Melainabacteria bacterium]|nr:MAG: acylphosphatase [Candidatus Melainabacteria bacterium]
MLTCIKLKIKGRVQGVFYRQSTCKEAIALGLFGWVKNKVDGSVEALVFGPDEKVQELVVWCHEGPPSAQVESVEVEDADQGLISEYLGRFVVIS